MLSPAIMVNTGVVYTFVIVVWSVFVYQQLDGTIQIKIPNTCASSHTSEPYFYGYRVLYVRKRGTISGSLPGGKRTSILL